MIRIPIKTFMHEAGHALGSIDAPKAKTVSLFSDLGQQVAQQPKLVELAQRYTLNGHSNVQFTYGQLDNLDQYVTSLNGPALDEAFSQPFQLSPQVKAVRAYNDIQNAKAHLQAMQAQGLQTVDIEPWKKKDMLRIPSYSLDPKMEVPDIQRHAYQEYYSHKPAIQTLARYFRMAFLPEGTDPVQLARDATRYTVNHSQPYERTAKVVLPMAEKLKQRKSSVSVPFNAVLIPGKVTENAMRHALYTQMKTSPGITLRLDPVDHYRDLIHYFKRTVHPGHLSN
jgi:hypothetical protein